MKGEIPKIAKQADVDVIVSKWDVVYQRSGVEFVDVADRMVQPFDPDESTLKVIKEVLKLAPVPLEELKKHEHYVNRRFGPMLTFVRPTTAHFARLLEFDR